MFIIDTGASNSCIDLNYDLYNIRYQKVLRRHQVQQIKFLIP